MRLCQSQTWVIYRCLLPSSINSRPWICKENSLKEYDVLYEHPLTFSKQQQLGCNLHKLHKTSVVWCGTSSGYTFFSILLKEKMFLPSSFSRSFTHGRSMCGIHIRRDLYYFIFRTHTFSIHECRCGFHGNCQVDLRAKEQNNLLT